MYRQPGMFWHIWGLFPVIIWCWCAERQELGAMKLLYRSGWICGEPREEIGSNYWLFVISKEYFQNTIPILISRCHQTNHMKWIQLRLYHQQIVPLFVMLCYHSPDDVQFLLWEKRTISSPWLLNKQLCKSKDNSTFAYTTLLISGIYLGMLFLKLTKFRGCPYFCKNNNVPLKYFFC